MEWKHGHKDRVMIKRRLQMYQKTEKSFKKVKKKGKNKKETDLSKKDASRKEKIQKEKVSQIILKMQIEESFTKRKKKYTFC